MQDQFKSTLFVMLIMGFMGNFSMSQASWFSSEEKLLTYYYITLDSNTSLKEFGTQLWQLARDEKCYGILLLIDNSGGVAANYSYLHDMVRRMRKIKPVVALITGNALSGGYWVASAADYIIAQSASNIGSIGICHEIQTWSDVQAESGGYKAKITPYVITVGTYKALSNPYKQEWSEQEVRYLQENIEKIYQVFLASVASDRNLDVADANEWVDGKTFIASEALKLGLIDEIGTRFEADEKILALMLKKYNNQA
jgi:protease IV